MIRDWKQRARRCRIQLHALCLASRDPRVPWYAKAVVGCVVAYALSPVDLIPDFIPVLGYLDDLILVPLGIALAVRLIPSPVWLDCRNRASDEPVLTGKGRWAAATFILLLYILAGGWCVRLLWRLAPHGVP